MKLKDFIPIQTWEVVAFIKVKLLETGTTQKELAEYIGITEASMSRYLTDGPGHRTMPFWVIQKALRKFNYTMLCTNLLSGDFLEAEE